MRDEQHEPVRQGRAAAAGPRCRAWIDDRFPMTALWKEHAVRVLRAEEFQLLVLLRCAVARGAGDPDRHRHLPDDELQALGGRSVRLRRIHHARCRLGLADPLHALDRRFRVFHRRLPAHVPRDPVRLVPAAARAPVDLRHADLSVPDGRGVLRLPAAVGQHVVLGRAGDRVAVRRDPGHRQLAGRVDPRRLLHLGRHAEPVLRAARRRVAARARIPRRRAHPGAARGRVEQPRRRRDQEGQGTRRHSARRHRVSSVLHGQGHGRSRCVPDPLQPRDLLRAGDGRLLPRARQLRPGQFAADTRAHRTRLVLHSVLRDPARGARTSWQA